MIAIGLLQSVRRHHTLFANVAAAGNLARHRTLQS
jgi:hypothetical protein